MKKSSSQGGVSVADLKDLLEASRIYGSDPEWVVAGGGNTSLKDGNILYVKASGFPLATISEEGFARMDRRKLATIWETEYPVGEDEASVAERERLVLADMMASGMPGEERRPSVETLLHELLPWPLVVHLHPTLVNGLTCSARGPVIAEEIFGNSQSWIPVTDPGYVLAVVIRDELENRRKEGLSPPDFIFLANHGVFVGGESMKEVRDKYSHLQTSLETRLQRSPGKMPEKCGFPANEESLSAVARRLFGPDARITALCGGELDRYLESSSAAAPLIGSITPDHIVYAGPGALYIDTEAEVSAVGEMAAVWEERARAYITDYGKPPNITLIRDKAGRSCAIAAAGGKRALTNAVLLLENALKVCAYAESFGGPLVLEERFIRFIVNWEVENYRSKVASD